MMDNYFYIFRNSFTDYQDKVENQKLVAEEWVVLQKVMNRTENTLYSFVKILIK